MKKYDMHTHSTASDGKLSPKELIDYSLTKKLSGIALTDHDTVRGINEALKYSHGKNIELIPGIEISCDSENRAKEVHVVGLYIDYKNKEWENLESISKSHKKQTANKILDKLSELGYCINIKDLEKKGGYSRPFIASALVEKYPNEFLNNRDVFNRYLGDNVKVNVMPVGHSMKYAIDTIHDAKGIAVLAHPGYLGKNDNYFIEKFTKLGGDAIEVECSYPRLPNPDKLRAKYRMIAKNNNLLISGGSDFHYMNEDNDLGRIVITEEEFLKLKNN